MPELDSIRFTKEEVFHDKWARQEAIHNIKVAETFKACTSPELRSIVEILGNVKGKRLLDVGCGLGEASVYFAQQGADVVATDISLEMLRFAESLARNNNVSIRTHKSTAESLAFEGEELFDIIYVGNLFHHVEIDSTITKLKRHLSPTGVMISWDPLAYNPLINIYRLIAKDVRTVDEHPLTIKDLNLFRKHFGKVKFNYFWFFTLVIFVFMFFFQRHNPNKVRFWKRVVDDSRYWAPIYLPLEKIDRILLKWLPILRPLCWNVVIVCEMKKA